MKLKDLTSPIIEWMWSIAYYLKNNLFAIMCLIQGILPMTALIIGFKLDTKYVLVCVVALITIQSITSYIKKLMESMGRGNDVPVPRERFTSADEYGEVTVRADRTQELILYVCDLEDYLERKGKL